MGDLKGRLERLEEEAKILRDVNAVMRVCEVQPSVGAVQVCLEQGVRVLRAESVQQRGVQHEEWLVR